MPGVASGGPPGSSGWVRLSWGEVLLPQGVGALEEKAGLCRVQPGQYGQGCQALLRAPWGPPWSPAGCDPSVPWGGLPGRRPASEPLSSLPEPSYVGRGAEWWTAEQEGQAAAGPCVFSWHWRPRGEPGPLSRGASI